MNTPPNTTKRRRSSSSPVAGTLELRRNRLGMSRTALAKRSGVSFPQIRRILDGKEHPRIDTLQAIAGALGMEVSILEKLDADDFRAQRAREKSLQLAGMVQGTMGLEQQAVTPSAMKSLVQQHMNTLLAGSGRALWDD